MPNIFFRVFYYLEGLKSPFEAGGAFYVPREYQGSGRHDIVEDGIIYCSLEALSTLVEKFDKFKNQHIDLDDLRKKNGSRLALVKFQIKGENLVDMRLPESQLQLKLTSAVMESRERKITQPIAKRIYDTGADGLIWNSSIESQWSNASLFHSRVKAKLELVEEVIVLDLENPYVREAADYWNISLK